MDSQDEYAFLDAAPSHTREYLGGPVIDLITREGRARSVARIFELGCGNGAVASELSEHGFDVTAVDVSRSGLLQASKAYPVPKFELASAYDDLPSKFGRFDVVLSLEVVEHLYAPRQWAKNLHALLVPGGLAIVSAPYHGYLKNLAIAVLGRFDSHLDPLWDHGHIKLWSVKSLSRLLEQAGFKVELVRRVGRIPAFAKSMILAARRQD
jgi:2-polyprenyl-6-hydroxyphenyl methylase/3-demethylubiquinone-9 3-methyltransferase